MPEPTPETPATVPPQRESTPPVRKSLPVILALVVIVALIGIANISSLVSGKKKAAHASTLPMQPAAPNAQQISSFETQQQAQAQQDADSRQRQQEIAAAMQQLQAAQDEPGPETAGTPPMTKAQRAAIYGDSPDAPAHTSNVSQAEAEAKQKALEREKQHHDAVNSDTVAIDFASSAAALAPATVALSGKEQQPDKAMAEAPGTEPPTPAPAKTGVPVKADPMAAYDSDSYQGSLYRVFEGTVLEGVVTNHIDGGLSGPIMLNLTTDLYSHDHQQLLLPQGRAFSEVFRA